MRIEHTCFVVRLIRLNWAVRWIWHLWRMPHVKMKTTRVRKLLKCHEATVVRVCNKCSVVTVLIYRLFLLLHENSQLSAWLMSVFRHGNACRQLHHVSRVPTRTLLNDCLWSYAPGNEVCIYNLSPRWHSLSFRMQRDGMDGDKDSAGVINISAGLSFQIAPNTPHVNLISKRSVIFLTVFTGKLRKRMIWFIYFLCDGMFRRAGYVRSMGRVYIASK